jgi:transporter family protein
MSWVVMAFCSAGFAGLTAYLAKMGVENVPSNTATFIRTLVVAVMSGIIVASTGELVHLDKISPRSWTFLTLSGIATGMSWLFYFGALKFGPISRVAPIDKLSFVIAVLFGVFLLHEKINSLTIVGVVLICFGVLITLPDIQSVILRTFGK